MSKGEGKKGFDIDGPFMHILEAIFHIWMLNLLTLICSIPIITFGAAYTAMNHQLYLIATKEDGYVIKGFFKDFASNFKRSTICWLLMLVAGGALGFDIFLFANGAEYSSWFKYGIYGLSVLYLFVFVYLFPILARYESKITLVFKNSLFMSVYAIIKTIPMVVLVLAPWILTYFVENFFFWDLIIGLSLPAFLNVFMYKKTFEAFEGSQKRAMEKNNESEGCDETKEESIPENDLNSNE